LECPYGNITEIPAKGIGINADTLKIRDACLVDSTKYKNEECSSDLNLPVILDYFNKTCVGKAECTLDLKNPDYRFFRPTDSARAKSCKSEHTEIFTQFSCTIDEAASAKKWN
jgi:hypothetical protein